MESAIFIKHKHRFPGTAILRVRKKKAEKIWEGRLSEEKKNTIYEHSHLQSYSWGKKIKHKHQKVARELPLSMNSVVCFGRVKPTGQKKNKTPKQLVFRI